MSESIASLSMYTPSRGCLCSAVLQTQNHNGPIREQFTYNTWCLFVLQIRKSNPGMDAILSHIHYLKGLFMVVCFRTSSNSLSGSIVKS